METRRGIGIGEVIVVLAIVLVIGLMLIMALPRSRDSARLAVCRRNLSEIGVGMALYNTAQNHLPAVPALGPEPPSEMSSPQAVLLQTLELTSFAGLQDPDERPSDRPGGPSQAVRIPGLLCPADSNSASRSPFPAPVNYRAATGARPDGSGGMFAPGRPPVPMADIDAADGLSYTAAFSERLVGTGEDVPGSLNYALVPGPVGMTDCSDPPRDAWKGDAGASWSLASWVLTLYNHALTPNAVPSCVSADGLTARMGASSRHAEGVNVLKGDLSVGTYTKAVDPKVWRALGNADDAGTLSTTVPPAPLEVPAADVEPDEKARAEEE